MSRILVIPDIHQHVLWLNQIFMKEGQDFDKIVLLGDLYDSFHDSKIKPVDDTLAYIQRLKESLGDKLVVLLGNHDISYYCVANELKYRNGYRHLKYACSGFTDNKARKIASVLNSDFMKSCKLCHIEEEAGKFIVFSHAGIHPHKIPLIPGATPLELLRNVESKLKFHWECEFPHTYSPWLEAGMARGGPEPIGGVTWLDDSEFDQTFPVCQITGHNTSANRFISWEDKSFCIDGTQTIYAVIEDLSTIRVQCISNYIYQNQTVLKKITISEGKESHQLYNDSVTMQINRNY